MRCFLSQNRHILPTIWLLLRRACRLECIPRLEWIRYCHRPSAQDERRSTMVLKRPNYFPYQFLREQDFKDEQEYHIEARRRHNKQFHSWGVVEGLEVKEHGEHEILIQPGHAVDKAGREIVLTQTVSRD